MKLLKFLFLALLCFQVNAGEWTILNGVSKFTPHGDGVWYQKAFPYELKMRSPSLGLRYDTTPQNGFSYGIGYMHLGKVKTIAEAVGVDGAVENDGGYDPKTQACNGPCMPVSHWYGSGQVQGVFGSVAKHYGPWSAEVGLYLYQPTWNMVIPDWRGCKQCDPSYLAVGGTAPWSIGPMLGLRYKVDKLSLNASMWHTATRNFEFPSIYHRMTTNFSIGYSF